jgi:hypothetical protein
MAFLFQLTEPGVAARAAEAARPDPWQTTEVEVVFSSGQTQLVRPDRSGLVYASTAVVERGATVTAVHTNGPHRKPLHWRMVSGRGVVMESGETGTVELSTRVRLSLWAFPFPFADARGQLDSGYLNLVQKAGIDDVTVVYGVLWNEKKTPPDVRWMAKSPAVGRWRELIAELHQRGVQFHLGYTIGDFGTYTDSFLGWLDKAGEGDIDKHAESIVGFMDGNKLAVDGLSFDFEMNALGQRSNHERNLARLFRKTAALFAARNGVVSYATGPFTSKYQAQVPHTAVQPYGLVRGAPNLIARPMCFDGTKAFPHQTVADSIDFALRPPADNDGAGIHPAQLQMGIWQAEAEKQVSMKDYCTKLLAPNRVGLIVYRMEPDPAKRAEGKALLERCAEFNTWLNGGGRSAHGQPLQVPQP